MDEIGRVLRPKHDTDARNVQLSDVRRCGLDCNFQAGPDLGIGMAERLGVWRSDLVTLNAMQWSTFDLHTSGVGNTKGYWVNSRELMLRIAQ